MPLHNKDGILSLNVKNLPILLLDWKNKPGISVRELIFNYVIYFYAYLNKPLT